MKYIKLYENFENRIDKFKELAGKTFKILKCDKIKTENGYKIEWEGFDVANIIVMNDLVYLDTESGKKEYELTQKDVAKLLADLTKKLNKIKYKKGLVSKKNNIANDLKNSNIPDDKIYSELGQRTLLTAVNFIEKGEPSEDYLRKVKNLINKS